MKLTADGVPFLRLGRLGQVHPRLHAWMPGGSHHPDTSVRGLKAIAHKARVVSPSPLSAPFIPASMLSDVQSAHAAHPLHGLLCIAYQATQHRLQAEQ